MTTDARRLIFVAMLADWRRARDTAEQARRRARECQEAMERARDEYLASVPAGSSVYDLPWRGLADRGRGMGLEPAGSSHIYECCKDAVDVARITGQSFSFTFNDHRITATRGQTWRDLAAAYDEQCGGSR